MSIGRDLCVDTRACKLRVRRAQNKCSTGGTVNDYGMFSIEYRLIARQAHGLVYFAKSRVRSRIRSEQRIHCIV